MNRRNVLAGVGTGAVASLAGCPRRLTGWSSLRVGLVNALDRAVELRVRIVVDGSQAFDRRFDLAAGANRSVEARLDVPWDATLVFHATHVGHERATERWSASVPLWGGNRCMMEPTIRVADGGVGIGPSCVG